MYSTKDDILNQIPEDELVFLTSEGATVDDVVVYKAIADADGIINGYLSVKYSVPLSSTPSLINNLSVAIAVYKLYSRRPKIEMNETIEKNYDDAVKMLKEIGGGTIGIGIDPPPEALSVPNVKSAADDRMFTKDSMNGF